jgi:hypothetical protein
VASLVREVNNIVEKAMESTSVVIRFGPSVLFSTETGDAWLLDPEEQLALCLARDYLKQDYYIAETPETFAVGWQAMFKIDPPTVCRLRTAGQTSFHIRLSDWSDWRSYPPRPRSMILPAQAQRHAYACAENDRCITPSFPPIFRVSIAAGKSRPVAGAWAGPPGPKTSRHQLHQPPAALGMLADASLRAAGSTGIRCR